MKTPRHTRLVHCLLVSALLSATGCQTAYYAAWEKLGKEKRHLLRDNVAKAKEEQKEAAEKFLDVLTEIKQVYGFDVGDLEAFYSRLNADYEACTKRAADVKTRTAAVRRIARDLFKEWEEELAQMANARLRASSQAALRDAQARYGNLERAMSRAELKLDPVLQQLKDYVLYLKHNLNAQAIGALRKEVESIETEVGALIGDMSKSIREAQDFLQNFE